MKEAIKAWLENPDHNYWDGITILEKYGSNLQLIYMLRRARTQANEERLAYELEKLVDCDSEQETASQSEAETGQSIESDLSGAQSGSSDSGSESGKEAGQDPSTGSQVEAAQAKTKNSDLLQGLLDDRAAKYAQRNSLSDTLADLDGEALKQASDQVQKIDDEIIALTTQIQFVEQKGHLPVPVIDLQEDLESFKKKKKSLGEKLSRIKAELKKTPGNLKKEAQVEDIKSQIANLEIKIKALTQTT